jgi:PAS domain S-box-containing protein
MTALRLLELLNRAEDRNTIIHDILRLIKDDTGFYAAGIRLEEEGDYPYYEVSGFSRDFVKSEKYLCARDGRGKAVSNPDGRLTLECVCGCVLREKFDPSLPFFTRGGSFWTNSASDFLAATQHSTLFNSPRNRCVKEGYETVALVPLRSGSGVIGLLQLNDRRKNLLDVETVRYFERIGASVGIALARIRVEEKLKEQVDFLERTLESFVHPFYVIDVADYHVKLANSAALQHGRSTTMSTCYRIHHGSDKPCQEPHHTCPLEEVVQSKKAVVVEHIHLDDEGNPLSVEVHAYPILDRNGNVVSMIEYCIDITERKKREEALRCSEERYALAQKAGNIGSWDWDIATGGLQWSETIEPMFGFERGEFEGTYDAFLRCVHPDDRQSLIDAINSCVEKGVEYDNEHRIVHPDGSVHWVRETGDVIRDRNDNAVRMLGVVHDITERKEAEEILKRDRENFEKLVDERTDELMKVQKELVKAARLSDIGTLAATVAHELRNPLGVIRTAAYNIGRKKLNPSIDRHLANIEKKIFESNRIINNLLAYSRIKMPDYKHVELTGIIEECIVATRERFSEYNLSITANLESLKGLRIDVDPFQIEEVVTNILGNACQSMPGDRGEIEIDAVLPERESVRIRFRDNGEGIDESDLKMVFEPFFTTRSKGTGLGLTICNELVKLHGGRIGIESEKDVGTTVTITLPTTRKPAG